MTRLMKAQQRILLPSSSSSAAAAADVVAAAGITAVAEGEMCGSVGKEGGEFGDGEDDGGGGGGEGEGGGEGFEEGGIAGITVVGGEGRRDLLAFEERGWWVGVGPARRRKAGRWERGVEVVRGGEGGGHGGESLALSHSQS